MRVDAALRSTHQRGFSSVGSREHTVPGAVVFSFMRLGPRTNLSVFKMAGPDSNYEKRVNHFITCSR